MQFQFLLLLEVDRGQHPVPNVFALRILEEFDVVEHVTAGFFAGFIFSASGSFAFEKVKEALDDCVISTVPATARATDQIVLR